jgi:hypothetical protein
MIITTWFEIGILNSSGILNTPSVQGDITFRNDNNFAIIIINRQFSGTGVATVTLQGNSLTTISRIPNIDLIVEVVRVDAEVEMPQEFPPPGTLQVELPAQNVVRTILSTENLTQLGSRLPPGTNPTFFIDSNGAINIISLF